ncbi:conserved hypothetical protein [Aster yellows witches'-broom phytoplasma AYWB]|uniref:Uncharacterized protein n=1 Tax=Aster yellows witches'-broom phytoplasma (strain AYWB) TaxID=322098 RepID=Q2NJE7_AYWBP|nr:hypothetical protein [Aster yellows witches'-broom phytoplasma]ABC65446.1 conserved hypothetical protein [Aster yellows witches'-broom phytoplasma AYWB]
MNIKLFNQKNKLVSFLCFISSIILILLLLLILSLQKRHSICKPSEKIQLTNNQNQNPNQQNLVKTSNLEKSKSQETKQIQPQIKNPKQIIEEKDTLPLYIQTVNGKKHYHFILPDSEFMQDGTLKNSETHVYMENLKPTLMHQMICKIQPQYDGWIACFPSFNGQDLSGVFLYSVMTGIKTPPLDLVGIYFESPFDNFDVGDWNKYTLDDILQMKNESQNIYFFWRTPKMTNIYKKYHLFKPGKEKYHPTFNKPRSPQNSLMLTEEFIDKFIPNSPSKNLKETKK